jgi:diacylglycerol kinase
MIDSISTFLSSVVELLQTGINGLVDAIAQVFNGEK